MKLALLGVDLESRRLAGAALAAGHEIVWAPDLGEAEPLPLQWRQNHPLLEIDSWEDLYDPDAAEAILVGRGAAGEEPRARQVQELARMGRPMLLTFPLFRSVLTYFEIDMARTEGDTVLQHFNPLIETPLLADVAAWIARGRPELGAVEQVLCTRWLGDRSRDRVLWHFTRDVELLDRTAGRLDRIGAHARAGGEAAGYAALSVQLLGSSEIPVRWAVEPPTGEEGMSLMLVCERGRLSMYHDAAGRLVNVVGPSGNDAPQTPPADLAPEGRALERFLDAVEAGDAAASTWPDALHAMELTDSIEISLRRGRMIDVHQQQLTEHLAFKGTMAAAGCGMLIVVIPLILAVGLIAGQFGIELADFWPHALLALLAIFLGLQLLPKLLYHEPPAKE